MLTGMRRWFLLLFLAVCIALLLAGLAGVLYYVAWNTHRTANRLYTSTVLLNRVNTTNDENLKRQIAFLLAQDVADTANDFFLFHDSMLLRINIARAAVVIGEPPYLSETQQGALNSHKYIVRDIHAVVVAYEKAVAANTAAMHKSRDGRMWLHVWNAAPAKMETADMAFPIVPTNNFSALHYGGTVLLVGSFAALLGGVLLMGMAFLGVLIGFGTLYFRYRKSPETFSDELRLRLCFRKKGETFWRRLDRQQRTALIAAAGITVASLIVVTLYSAFPRAMQLPFLSMYGVIAIAVPLLMGTYAVFLQKTPSLPHHSPFLRRWVTLYAWSLFAVAAGFFMCQGTLFAIHAFSPSRLPLMWF